jgi:hypothetical protein
LNFKIGAMVLLLAVCCAPASPAPDTPRRASNGEPSSHASELASGVKASAGTPTDNSEVFLNILIPAGKAVTLDSDLDFTDAAAVAVTVPCAICSSASTSLGSAGLTLQARWMVREAIGYAATENKSAAAFSYWDSGGAIFSVYGSQFRLVLQNKGDSPISLQQVTLFRRNQ